MEGAAKVPMNFVAKLVHNLEIEICIISEQRALYIVCGNRAPGAEET